MTFVICVKHVFSRPVMNEIERKHLILILKSYEVEIYTNFYSSTRGLFLTEMECSIFNGDLNFFLLPPNV